WYALLDFVRFLKNHVTPVHDVLSGALDPGSLNPAEQALLERLEQIVINPTVELELNNRSLSPEHTLRDALARLATPPASNTSSIGDDLESVKVPYDSEHPVPAPDPA